MVAEVLSNPALEAEWRAECKAMADRIIAMRKALRDGLMAAGSTKDWSHVTSQIGSEQLAPLVPVRSLARSLLSCVSLTPPLIRSHSMPPFPHRASVLLHGTEQR